MDIICSLAIDVNLPFVGRVLAGLYALPKTRVHLRFEPWMTSAFSLALEADHVRYGIDLSDHADLWDFPLLHWSDIYAKRSMRPGHQPVADARKVVPFGLHCAGTSWRSVLAVLRGVARCRDGGLLRNSGELLRYARGPHYRGFEQTPAVACKNTILYQTRIWDPSETPGDEHVNEKRISLLEDLRREFKDRLIGGLVPNAYGLATRPDLVTVEPVRQTQYLRVANESAIGIYSRGLFGSYAFKMTEFLAGSKCIVSDVMENLLYEPLKHVSIYRTNDECIAQCEALLSDPRRVQDQREQSWLYYEAYARPERLILKLFSRTPNISASID